MLQPRQVLGSVTVASTIGTLATAGVKIGLLPFLVLPPHFERMIWNYRLHFPSAFFLPFHNEAQHGASIE